jgi:hypothetical protein
VGRGIISAAGSSPARTLFLYDVKKVALHATYVLDITYPPGSIHTGNSLLRVSYKTIIKSDYLDVKASDMLLMPGVEDFVEY